MFYIWANNDSIYEPIDEGLIVYSPKLSLEMGKAGSLQFKVPPNHRFYDKFETFKTLIRVEYDDVEIFRGRVLTNNRDFNNNRTIYCEGDLAYLLDSVQKSDKYTGNVHELFGKIIAAHNEKVEDYKKFTVGEITIENRNIVVSGKSSVITKLDTKKFDYKQIAINCSKGEWLNTFDYIQNYIISYCGGYLRTRRVGNTTYIDLLKEYGTETVQDIEFGVNLLDLTEDTSTDEMFTVLIPVGDKNTTIEKVNSGSNELVDEAGVERFGRIVKTHTFSSVKKPKTLLENAKRYLENHENAKVTISAKAVDMHLADPTKNPIYVGDKVRLKSVLHDMRMDLTCTKIEYDFERPDNNTYTFGDPKQTLTERYRKDKTGGGGGGKKASGGGTPSTDTDDDGNIVTDFLDNAKESASNLVSGVIDEVTDFFSSETDSKIEEATNEFYDAYIGFDKSAGTVTLKALWEEKEAAISTLKRITGIDLNAPAGEVNMYSMRQALDETIQNLARVQTKADENESRVTLTASYLADLDDKTSEHIAELVVRADANESAIEGKADKISFESLVNTVDNTNNVLQRELGIFLDGTQGNVNLQNLTKTVDENGTLLSQARADIKTHTDDISSTMQLLTSFTNDTNEHLASIDLWANEQESGIKLMADKIEAQGKRINLKADDSMVLGMKKTLKRDCGIDVDATTGNVNLRNLSTTVDNQGKILSTAQADLKTVTDAQKATAKLFASYQKDNEKHVASIEATANKAESSLTLKADKTTVDSALFEIKGRLDADEATIKKLKTDYGEIDNLISKKASALFLNSLRIVADGIKCSSLNDTGTATFQGEATFTKLITANAGMKSSSYITCSSTITGNEIKMGSGKDLVATQKWVNNQNFMTSIPTDKLITVKTLKATDNIQIGTQKVATQYWCMNEKNFMTEDQVKKLLTWDNIQGKPSTFKPSGHKHKVSLQTSFAWGHVHTDSGAGNVKNYKNKEITVSGTTETNT